MTRVPERTLTRCWRKSVVRLGRNQGFNRSRGPLSTHATDLGPGCVINVRTARIPVRNAPKQPGMSTHVIFSIFLLAQNQNSALLTPVPVMRTQFAKTI